jgi:hypothetical protein
MRDIEMERGGHTHASAHAGQAQAPNHLSVANTPSTD